MKRRLVLLGPPGSGKGTVAEQLEKRFKLEHVSTGQWFRREMSAGTELGQKVEEYIVRGELVPDEVVLGLLEHWVTPDLMHHGFLLDGFPRTQPQAAALDAFCAERNAPLDAVLYLNCPESVIVDRITGRRVCSNCGRIYHLRSTPPQTDGVCNVCGGELMQRSDDTVEVVHNRLQFYQRVTQPLVDYYRQRGKLVALNAASGSNAALADAVGVVES
jgi:adenylate kinase